MTAPWPARSGTGLSWPHLLPLHQGHSGRQAGWRKLQALKLCLLPKPRAAEMEARGGACGGSAPAPEAPSDSARPFGVASDEEPSGGPGSQESCGPPRADEEVQGALPGPEEGAPTHLGVHELSGQTSLDKKYNRGTKDSGKPDDRTLVFLQQGPLVLVAVSRTPQSAAQLRCELLGVHAQIVSVLTRAGVARVFERQRSYDLRRLLAGSERILDSLLDGAEREPGFLLGAVRCLPLPAPFRDSLGALLQRATAPSLAFSILAAGRHLVTAAQERAVLEDCRLDPADLHLLLNLVGASSAFRAGEVWAPVCLPRFNPDGFFYAYVSYLGDNTDYAICLVLLSTDREAFHALAGCKRIVEEGLQALGASRVLAGGGVGLPSYGVSAVGAPDLRHFLYKPFDVPDNYRQLPQFTSPEMEGPYASECERQRLFDLYYHLHGRLHSPSRPLRLIYHVAEKETLLAWVTPKFELYACFNPLVTKSGAIHAVTKLLRWVKREEDRLFIRYPPKYSTAPVRHGPNRTDSALENGL
ncbi:vacuolar fusion protein MON1 homolog B isoform X2 [Phascolarctos cinereus]|uniref:Vacuolar fusion protein MON1 homolog n=1 Tax=Phascolarctos cinereus TaxID=38626 RepID=A0A6P5JD26_PHACI|nr:vacuolar fusion protein MON1 homolog B isoform X2 [Phascolarctos cinereus]